MNGVQYNPVYYVDRNKQVKQESHFPSMRMAWISWFFFLQIKVDFFSFLFLIKRKRWDNQLDVEGHPSLYTFRFWILSKPFGWKQRCVCLWSMGEDPRKEKLLLFVCLFVCSEIRGTAEFILHCSCRLTNRQISFGNKDEGKSINQAKKERKKQISSRT